MIIWTIYIVRIWEKRSLRTFKKLTQNLPGVTKEHHEISVKIAWLHADTWIETSGRRHKTTNYQTVTLCGPDIRLWYNFHYENYTVTVSTGHGLVSALSPGVKRQGHEAHRSIPSSVEVKNNGAIPQLLNTSSWQNVELIKHRDNFTKFVYCYRLI
jgi:hypothetical protein